MNNTLKKSAAVAMALLSFSLMAKTGSGHVVSDTLSLNTKGTQLHFEYAEEETVDLNKLYDDLCAMYGLRIYSAHTSIPQYFQTDYEHVEFSDSTVANEGCGITCLAMVATYLLDEVLLPDQMAYRFDCGSNPAAAMVSGIRNLGLSCNTYYGDAIHEHVWRAIENGQPVIVLMRRESLFTTGGHFIVIAGMTEDGKYIVNDPNKKNYGKEDLREKYRTGFTKQELCQGLTGVYIFDKKQNEKTETVLSVYESVMNRLT